MNHKCIRFGPIRMTVNGPIWYFSMDIGRFIGITIWEKK